MLWPEASSAANPGHGIVRDLVIGGHRLNICVVAHPSMPNARNRRHGALQGAEGESALVHETVQTGRFAVGRRAA